MWYYTVRADPFCAEAALTTVRLWHRTRTDFSWSSATTIIPVNRNKLTTYDHICNELSHATPSAGTCNEFVDLSSYLGCDNDPYPDVVLDFDFGRSAFRLQSCSRFRPWDHFQF
ncbi:hypothetical protein EVAR_43216_1 [Eumeta japonica]|uniref:Uncharacterized protein n=1 Tax=Eumeta variegata TaxID=151549 RepID=A0A4C1WSG0_EUMVA|nr:hypothetical protein EVAR_43216_1 [Eumeta japonica]